MRFAAAIGDQFEQGTGFLRRLRATEGAAPRLHDDQAIPSGAGWRQ